MPTKNLARHQHAQRIAALIKVELAGERVACGVDRRSAGSVGALLKVADSNWQKAVEIPRSCDQVPADVRAPGVGIDRDEVARPLGRFIPTRMRLLGQSHGLSNSAFDSIGGRCSGEGFCAARPATRRQAAAPRRRISRWSPKIWSCRTRRIIAARNRHECAVRATLTLRATCWRRIHACSRQMDQG
jgi:hypothetical protein